MEIQRLVDEFIEHLRLERKTPTTIRTYGYALRKWALFAQGYGCYETALRFLDQYDNPRTRSSSWIMIRGFIKFLASRGLCEDWTGRIVIKAQRATRHTVLTQGEIAAILAACGKSWIGNRDHTMIVLFLCTGARRDEIRTLKASDVVLDGSYFTNRCKGGNIEKFHLTEYARHVLAQWMRQYGGGEYLFRAHYKRTTTPLDGGSVRNIFQKVFKRAGVDPEKAHPHSLRHTMAQRLLEAGHPLETVAKCLHHRSICSTQIYAQVRDQTAAMALDGVFGSPVAALPELSAPQRIRDPRRFTTEDVADWI